MAATLSAKSGFARSAVRSAAVRPRVAARRTVTVRAKYGEESKYFDLKDLENSTGSWDLYGSDEGKRYPDIQSTFFNRAGDILTRRDALRGFIAIGGIAGIATFGNLWQIPNAGQTLPIVKGPQTAGESGKGGSLRSRL